MELNEELQIDGLIYLGTAFGYDVYDAQTWAALDQLVVAGSTTSAGHFAGGAEAIFNAHVNAAHPFYVFTHENTNGVVAAAIKQDNNPLRIVTGAGTFSTQSNYAVESSNGQLAVYRADLPLYLLPNFTCDLNDGMLIINNTVKGVFNGAITSPRNTPAQIPEYVTAIDAYAFGSDFPKDVIRIPSSVQQVATEAFNDFTGTIEVDNSETATATWGINGRMWAPHAHEIRYLRENTQDETEDEDIAEIEDEEDIDLEPVEAEIEELPDEDAELEDTPSDADTPVRPQQTAKPQRTWAQKRTEVNNLPDLDVLYYRDTKNGIVIEGCWKGRLDLRIPAQINGKDVVEIAPFAFYGQPMDNIYLPNTIKTIGRSAFMNSGARVFTSTNKIPNIYKDAFKNAIKY